MSGRILGDTMARRSFGVAAVHSFNSLLPHCSRELLRLAPNMSLVVAFSNSYRLHTAKRAREGFDGHVRRGHERGAPVRSLPSDSLNASFEKGRGFNGRGPAVTPVGKFRFFLRGGARWTSSETRSFSGDRRDSCPFVASSLRAEDSEVSDQTRRFLETLLVEVLEYYNLPYRGREEGSASAGESEGPLRVALLLPPSVLSVAALQALWSLGLVGVPLPFEETCIGVETAGKLPCLGGYLGGSQVGRAAPAGSGAGPSLREAPNEFFTEAIPCTNSIISKSPSIRRFQQRLAESRVRLVLVNPSLASVAAAVAEPLGVYVTIVRSPLSPHSEAAASETDPLGLLPGKRERDSGFVQAFVRQAQRCGSEVGGTQRWKALPVVPSVRSSAAEPELGPSATRPAGTNAASAWRTGGALFPTGSEEKALGDSDKKSGLGRSDLRRRAPTPLRSVPLLHLGGGLCFGRPRAAVFEAAAVAELRAAEWLSLQHANVVVAGDSASLARSKLLLAALLPAVEQRARVAVVTGRRADPVPLPAWLSLRQTPEAEAAEQERRESATGRAEALWTLLQQQHQGLASRRHTHSESRTRGLRLFVDLATAEALAQTWKERLNVSGTTAASEGDSASSALESLENCCVCTDEQDFFPPTVVEKTETVEASGATEDGKCTQARHGLSRLASVLQEWRRLLPTTTRVEHLLSLSEMGPVALLQQKGAVFCKEEDGTDVATGQLDGKSGALFVGELLPGVSASTDQDGILHFQSSRGSAGYFGRPTATAAYFTEHGFASPLVGRLERNRREVWLTGSSQLLQALGKRPLAERLQQWQWSLPRMERLPEGYVHKVPITGKEWGNYHAKKRNWKRIF